MRKRHNRARIVRLRESAAVLDRPATTIALVEAAPPLPAVGKCRKYRACLIEGDRWGSRGYYPAAMLAADGPLAWPAGTHMYFDHPSLTEEADRPERSLKGLVGTIASTPEYQTDGPQGPGLYADVSVYPSWQGRIDEMAGDIGLSIRASGTAEPGTRDGRSGMVITSIAPSPTNSVDYVTHAGAGGKLVALLEAAREQPSDPKPLAVRIQEAGSIGAWFEARIHSGFTEMGDDMYGWGQLTREERIALSSAIGSALDAFVTTVQAKAPQLYQRDQWGDKPTTPIQPDPQPEVEVEPEEEPEPIAVTEADQPPKVPAPPEQQQPQEEAPMSGSTAGATEATTTAAPVAPIDPAETARITALETQLVEAQRVAAEATQRINAIEAAELARRNGAAARATVTRLVEASEIDARVRAAVLPLIEAAALAHVTPLTTEVDQTALDAAVAAAITSEQARVAQIAEAFATTTTTPTAGFGAATQGVTTTPTVDAAQVRQQLAETYRARGMSEKAAAAAAAGRGF